MVCRALLWLCTGALFLVPRSGFAGAFVVFDGEDPGLAVARVAVALSRPPGDFSGVTWSSHRDSLEPSLLGVGSLAECEGDPVDAASISQASSKAEGSLNFMEYDKALSLIADARASIGCLSVPLESTVVGRLLFLEGVIHMEQGDKMAAWGSFQAAQIADPALVWDENFPPDSKPVFVAAQAELQASATTEFGLAPLPGDLEVWIDGRAIAAGSEAVALKGRQHWIQWRDSDFHSAELLIDAGVQIGILLPSGLGELPLHVVTSESHQRVLSTLMASIGAPGDEIFLTTLGGVWSHVVGKREFKELVAPTEEPPVLDSAGGPSSESLAGMRALPAWRSPLFLAGAGIAVAAGGLSAQGWSKANGAWEDFKSDSQDGGGTSGLPSNDDYDAVADDFQKFSQHYRLGGMASLAGVALAGVSLALGTSDSVSASAWGTTGEVGARLTWSR